jgi:hypothetical protein
MSRKDNIMKKQTASKRTITAKVIHAIAMGKVTLEKLAKRLWATDQTAKSQIMQVSQKKGEEYAEIGAAIMEGLGTDKAEAYKAYKARYDVIRAAYIKAATPIITAEMKAEAKASKGDAPTSDDIRRAVAQKFENTWRGVIRQITGTLGLALPKKPQSEDEKVIAKKAKEAKDKTINRLKAKLKQEKPYLKQAKHADDLNTFAAEAYAKLQKAKTDEGKAERMRDKLDALCDKVILDVKAGIYGGNKQAQQTIMMHLASIRTAIPDLGK